MTTSKLQLVQIGECIGSIRTWNPAQDSEDETFRYIDISSVSQEEKRIIPNGEMPIAEAPSRARQLVQAGDVLVSTVRPNLNAVAYVPEDMNGATASTGFCVLRPEPSRVYGRYLFHWVRTPRFISDMVKQATGQSYPAVSDRLVKQSFLPLPPLGKQKSIAAVLDQADELRQLQRRSIDRLEELAQALFYEMFGDPATNPFGFKQQTLGKIIEFIGGSQPPKTNFLYEDGPDRVRFVQTRDFRTDEYKTYVPKHLAKRPFVETDVMIGRYGPPVFQIFRGLSGTYNVALMKASPRDGITSDFVYYLLQEAKLHSYVVSNSERTAGQSGVNLDLLDKYPAYKPPLKLQNEFSRRIQVVQQQTLAQNAQQHALDKLFNSLQNLAFRGEL